MSLVKNEMRLDMVEHWSGSPNSTHHDLRSTYFLFTTQHTKTFASPYDLTLNDYEHGPFTATSPNEGCEVVNTGVLSPWRVSTAKSSIINEQKDASSDVHKIATQAEMIEYCYKVRYFAKF